VSAVCSPFRIRSRKTYTVSHVQTPDFLACKAFSSLSFSSLQSPRFSLEGLEAHPSRKFSFPFPFLPLPPPSPLPPFPVRARQCQVVSCRRQGAPTALLLRARFILSPFPFFPPEKATDPVWLNGVLVELVIRPDFHSCRPSLRFFLSFFLSRNHATSLVCHAFPRAHFFSEQSPRGPPPPCFFP